VPPQNEFATFMNEFFGAVLMLWVLVATRGYIEEFSTMTAQSGLSAKVAKAVAKKMARYDTVGMRAIIDEYALDPLHDNEVAKTYRRLLVNLESYRPHLPTWVLPQDQANDDEEGGASDEDPASLEAELRAEDARDAADGANSHGRSPHSSQGREVIVVAGADGDTKSVRSQTSDRSSVPTAHGAAAAALSRPGWVWGVKTKVALASVRFELLDGCDANVKHFVEAAHRVARETQAVLHSFVNNTLIASWGATSGAARPELNALRFFARLGHLARQQQPDEDDDGAAVTAGFGGAHAPPAALRFPHVAMSGACCVGPATCRLAGGAQQALVVETPAWADVLDRLARFARAHRTFVCPAGIVADVVEVSTRLVGAVAVPAGAADSCVKCATLSAAATDAGAPHVPVAEVLGEREMKEDEWMYVLENLQKAAATPDNAVSSAVKRCLAGDVAAAHAELAKVPLSGDGAATRPATVRWLLKATQRATTVGAFVKECSAES